MRGERNATDRSLRLSTNRRRFSSVRRRLQEDRLKLALLDYLKRNDASSDGSDASSDTDTLTMVALHFTMYREIARTLEQRAGTLLSTLSADALGKRSRVV